MLAITGWSSIMKNAWKTVTSFYQQLLRTGKFHPFTDKLFKVILNTIKNGMKPEAITYANIREFYWAAQLSCTSKIWKSSSRTSIQSYKSSQLSDLSEVVCK